MYHLCNSIIKNSLVKKFELNIKFIHVVCVIKYYCKLMYFLLRCQLGVVDLKSNIAYSTFPLLTNVVC